MLLYMISIATQQQMLSGLSAILTASSMGFLIIFIHIVWYPFFIEKKSNNKVSEWIFFTFFVAFFFRMGLVVSNNRGCHLSWVWCIFARDLWKRGKQGSAGKTEPEGATAVLVSLWSVVVNGLTRDWKRLAGLARALSSPSQTGVPSQYVRTYCDSTKLFP